MELPSELKESRELLEEAERTSDHKKKVRHIGDALDLLEEFLAEEGSSEKHKDFAKNLRRAHTRILLLQLFQIRDVTIEIWFGYIPLLLLRLSEEIREITDSDPQIKRKYNDFIGIWRQDLLDALEK